jgi:hypothetical protein
MHRVVSLRSLSVLFLLAGCATVPTTPGSGWREVTSAHFQVRTNLDETEARTAVLDLERYRAALLARWKHPELMEGAKARMVIYADPSDFREHGARSYDGFFRSGRGQPLLVEARGTFTQDGLGLAKTNAHELAHHVDAAVLLRQPRWLNEGLASYLSTVTVADGKAVFGRGQIDFVQAAHMYKPLTVEELFGWDTLDVSKLGDGQLSRYYVWSWAWVTYLENERRAEFDDFLGRLARAEEPRAAFSAAFGNLDDAKTAVAVRELLTRILPTEEVALPAVSPALTTRPLTPAEYHAMEANVWRSAPGTWTEAQSLQFARGELAQALASEPKNPEALALAVEIGPEAERLAHARELTHVRPDDGAAWILLADALGTGAEARDERGQAFGQALAHAGDNPYVLTRVSAHLMNGNPKLALELSTHAVKLAPYDVHTVEVLGFAEAANGACEQARRDGTRALDLLSERAPKAARDGIAHEFEQILSSCQPKPAP